VAGELFLDDLVAYFPGPLRERFRHRIDQHPLRREIIATNLANHVLNRMGATFLMRVAAITGNNVPTAARAFVATRDIYDLRDLWYAVDALDNQVTTDHQHAILQGLCGVQERATVRMLRQGLPEQALADHIHSTREAVQRLDRQLPDLLAERDCARLEAIRAEHVAAGVPEALAGRLSRLPTLYAAPDIDAAARRHQTTLEEAGRIHFGAADLTGANDLQHCLQAFNPADDWQARYQTGLVENLHEEQRRLTETILAETPAAETEQRLQRWIETNQEAVDHFRQTVEQITAAAQPDTAMLGVAMQSLHWLSRPHQENAP